MRVGKANGRDWLRLSEAASSLGVSLNTLRRWSDSGKLVCYRSPGGHRRYRQADVEALLRAQSREGRPTGAPGLLPAFTAGDGDLDLLGPPLSILARVAAEGIGATSCVFALLVGESRVRIVTGYRQTEGQPFVDEIVLLDDAPAPAEVLRSGRRLVIADLTATSLLAPGAAEVYREQGQAALLALPLVIGGRHAGVMQLADSRAPRAFTGANVAFAEFMARQAARLVAGNDRRQEEAAPPDPGLSVDPHSAPATAGLRPDPVRTSDTALRDFADRLREDLGDVKLLVAATLRMLSETFALSACVLYMVDQGKAVTLADGLPASTPDGWLLEEYPPAAAAVAQRAVVVIAGDDDPRLTPEATARFLTARGLAEVALAPLVYRDGIVGLLEVGSEAPGRMSAIVAALAVAADLLAALLGGADMVAGLRRHNRDLAQVVEAGLDATARRSADEVLRAVVERIAELTGAPVADAYAVENDTLRALASYDGGRFNLEREDVVIPLLRYPSSRRAVETGEMMTIASLGDPLLSEEARYSLEKWGYQAQLSVPLISGGRVIGLIEISDYVPRDFAAHLDLVRGLCGVAAHALENAAVLEQAERRSRILNELVALGDHDGRTSGLDGLLRHVAERLQAAVDAANCDIFRVTGDGLRCVASFDRSGYDERPVGDLLDLESYPTVEAAMNSHHTLIITSPDDPQLSESERRTYREYGYASEVCVPLVVNGQLYGLIDIYDTRERDYTEYLSFLKGAGQTLARVFENALLVERLEGRQRILREIVDMGAVTSQSRDLEGSLGALAERTRAAIGAADCDIYALQGENLRCVVSADLDGLDEAVVGKVLDLDRFPATAMAVRSGESMAVPRRDDPRLSAEERESMIRYGFESELCIPLIADERVIGLIDVFDTRPRDYGEYIDFLSSVGQMAAGAIQNYLLVDELEHRNAALAELVELGKVVTGAGGLDDLVRAVGPRVVDVVGATGCQIFAVRDGLLHCLLTFENGEYEDDYVGRSLDLDEFPSTREALERRETLVIESPDDPRLSDYERSLYIEAGSRSEICVPLFVDEHVVGLLDVYDRRRRDYADHRDFLTNVGQIVAGAFAQAALVDRLEVTNQTLSLLVESGLEFGATLRLDDVLQSVARRLCAAADAPGCDIYTIDGDMLRCVACIDRGKSDDTYVGTTYLLSELRLIREALTTHQAVVVPDVATDLRLSSYERDEELRWGNLSKIELPLISHGEVIGLAGIFDDHPREFDQLDLLRSLAQGAAHALANATLYDRLDRAAERLTLVNDLSFELSASLDLDQVLAAAARRLCAVAGVDACDIYTLHDDEWLRNVVSIVAGQLDLSWQRREFALRELAAPQKAVRTRRPVLVRTLGDPVLLPDERALMEEYGETGELVVPLISKDRVIGVLELLETSGPCSLSGEQIETIFAASRVAALAIDNAGLFKDVKRLHLSNLKALSSALNAKDYYLLGHAARVAAYMVLLGRELGWPTEFLRHVEEASYLHDIGKIGVSDRVLLKPSVLNPREWELMRQHPVFSADIIRPLFDEKLVAGVRHHHEAFDGTGYPDGLAGDQIPELARAMCVVDSYDAMSFHRPYRKARSYAACLAELESCGGAQFDPDMVAAFLPVLEGIANGRRFAAEVARKAAARIDPEQHALLRTREDERRPEFAAITGALLAVWAANPPTRYISTHVRRGTKTVIVCDSGEASIGKPHLGDETVTDDEFVEVFEGRSVDATVLFVDQWGVWISGVAPLLDAEGKVTAVIAAEIQAAEGMTQLEGLHGKVAQTFSSMLQTAAAQAGRTEIEAITDSLTGLYNHRYLHERLSEEIDRCVEQGNELALLLLDLDAFRDFNERRGHSAGDGALRTVARILEDSVRQVDLVARFGGEEFADVLVDVGEERALEVAERIRTGIAKTQFAPGGDSLSVSIGVAVCPGDAAAREELIDKADWAVHVAKRRGRNKVVAFSVGDGAAGPERMLSAHAERASTMAELVSARETYVRRRREAIAHLSLAVARDFGLDEEGLREVAAAAGAAVPSAPLSFAQQIVALATAYQAMVVERQYRARASEAEALRELLGCPALLYDRGLAAAFARVLGE
ncbi:MAG: GAF domain-containing protein [Actinobacteria bacterium]|nr:GAF domain-containing protein [Actinomycetota bacterium]